MQVGGLRDTVQQFNPYENTGTGWTFEWADGGNFRYAHPASPVPEPLLMTLLPMGSFC